MPSKESLLKPSVSQGLLFTCVLAGKGGVQKPHRHGKNTVSTCLCFREEPSLNSYTEKRPAAGSSPPHLQKTSVVKSTRALTQGSECFSEPTECIRSKAENCNGSVSQSSTKEGSLCQHTRSQAQQFSTPRHEGKYTGSPDNRQKFVRVSENSPQAWGPPSGHCCLAKAKGFDRSFY